MKGTIVILILTLMFTIQKAHCQRLPTETVEIIDYVKSTLSLGDYIKKNSFIIKNPSQQDLDIYFEGDKEPTTIGRGTAEVYSLNGAASWQVIVYTDTGETNTDSVKYDLVAERCFYIYWNIKKRLWDLATEECIR